MNLSEYKEIIKFAMQNEIEAKKFYEDVAAKIENSQLKEMFITFAAEEERHRKILNRIFTSNRIEDYFDAGQDYHVAEGIEEPALSTDMKPADAIALAMKKEEEAMVQYKQMAQSCPEPEKKQVFLDLAAMEQGHKQKMENAFVDIGYPEVW
jgi:rubrerythrin